MFKVKQIDCIVNIRSKTNLTYFPKILKFMQMLKRFEIWKQKFTNFQSVQSRFESTLMIIHCPD